MVLTPVEAVLIEDGEVVVGTNGIVDQREETCLAEEVILLLEEADLNIRLLITTPVRNTILVSQSLWWFRRFFINMFDNIQEYVCS